MDDSGPLRKRRKGGVSQRTLQSEKDVEADGALFALLLAKFAAGIFSAATFLTLQGCGHQGLQSDAKNKICPSCFEARSSPASHFSLVLQGRNHDA